MPVNRLIDHAGAWGSVLSAMGCAVCFPAIALLGANIGLGFLKEYEFALVNWLLPFFALLALAANGASWFSHHRWKRTAFGMAGPAMVLLALYLWRGAPQAAIVLYVGLAMMVAVSIWDLLFPVSRLCPVDRSDPSAPA